MIDQLRSVLPQNCNCIHLGYHWGLVPCINPRKNGVQSTGPLVETLGNEHGSGNPTHVWLVVWTPLKNISQLGWLFPIYGKIKDVPNHQPDVKTTVLFIWKYDEHDFPGVMFQSAMIFQVVESVTHLYDLLKTYGCDQSARCRKTTNHQPASFNPCQSWHYLHGFIWK